MNYPLIQIYTRVCVSYAISDLFRPRFILICYIRLELWRRGLGLGGGMNAMTQRFRLLDLRVFCKQVFPNNFKSHYEIENIMAFFEVIKTKNPKNQNRFSKTPYPLTRIYTFVCVIYAIQIHFDLNLM